MSSMNSFLEDQILNELKHYLPAQAPLKDFVHHNTLHAFQGQHFEKAIRDASKIFGYKTILTLKEYRDQFEEGRISPEVLKNVIIKRHEINQVDKWMNLLLNAEYQETNITKTGQLRKLWKDYYNLDLNSIVQSNLFRILNSYLDQGIAISKFPVNNESFLSSIIEIEQNSYISFFKTKRARNLLFDDEITIKKLLELLVGDSGLFGQYLFDQQFAHPGWSGMVSAIEGQPHSLLDGRKITLKELIIFECLLEIDNLDYSLKKGWKPLGEIAQAHNKIDLFEDNVWQERDELLMIWQEAFEWTFYDQVLFGIRKGEQLKPKANIPSFEAFFCIDDRSCSLRRYIEQFDPNCSTYGTPGHFGIDAFFLSKNAKHYSKICPQPVQPKHLIKEVTVERSNESDLYFNKSLHDPFKGWLITQTLGLWSAIKLMFNIFKPSLSPATSLSFSHMSNLSNLTVENRSRFHYRNNLQIGYTVEEMAERVKTVLVCTGATTHFAPLIYIIGHGSSTTNNTHYAGYDCGACSGRPGSVNARTFSYMANHAVVRETLKLSGIIIPEATEFIGGMHDTTRDEILFFDEEFLSPQNKERHRENTFVFEKALELNAKERSRRFLSIDSTQSAEEVHRLVKKRSVSLFEPRPELNHATNALCIIGRKNLHDHLFLDRRSFLNSYNYEMDPDGKYLLFILNAAAPVCGGINLEYYFSRVDNERLGAGSKLPHNVIGLIAVANGFEGDLRPGLPKQMIEVHDPLRLMMIVEHDPEVVLKVLKSSNSLYEWFINKWMHLSVINPVDNQIYRFVNGAFERYNPVTQNLQTLDKEGLNTIIESTHENLPVFLFE